MPYLVDACQAVGQLPIDVSALGADFVGATARKFLRGPRGIGFLYVSDRMLDEGRIRCRSTCAAEPLVSPERFELVDDARRFENWEFSYALVLGLGAAARYALDVGVDVGGARAGSLAALVRERLARARQHGSSNPASGCPRS